MFVMEGLWLPNDLVDCPLRCLDQTWGRGELNPPGGGLHMNYSLGRSFHPPANDLLKQE